MYAENVWKLSDGTDPPHVSCIMKRGDGATMGGNVTSGSRSAEKSRRLLPGRLLLLIEMQTGLLFLPTPTTIRRKEPS